MEKEKIDLEEIVALSKELFHQYYAGNPKPWFSYLCKDSVYLGTGDPILFGAQAIEEHFSCFQEKTAVIIEEEYFPIALDDRGAQVCGQIIIRNPSGTYGAVTHFTMGYRIIGGEIKLVHQHNSYEYMQPKEKNLLKLDLTSIQFIRSLLSEKPSVKPMAIRSGTQTVFLNPYIVLYVQSQRKNTEIVCIDRVISCNSSIGELAQKLPPVFYHLHRSYLVNTLYIVAIRRFEAELVSGICLPIPAMSYTRVKAELGKII